MSHGTGPFWLIKMARDTPKVPPWTILAAGTLIGSFTVLLLFEKTKEYSRKQNRATNKDPVLHEKRQRLPSLILLLRHAESEGNADHTLWRTKPDNLISLTEQGIQEAATAGKRIELLFQIYDQRTNNKISRVHIHVSPYERTLQTAKAARRAFEHRIVRTSPESRIREQEFGNYSLKDSLEQREEQKQV